MSTDIKTPRTDFVAHETGDSEWNRFPNRFGRMMAHACILEAELAAATARIAELEAEKALVNSHIAELEAANKRLREPMPEQVCNDLIDEWLDKDPKWVDLVRRVEAWHANE